MNDGVEGTEKTMREHLLMVAHVDDSALQQLVGPEVPAALVHVWQWWCELHSRRSDSGMGFTSLDEPRVEAYFSLYGLPAPHPVELRALWQIELDYRRYRAKLDDPPSHDEDDPDDRSE